MRRAVVDEARAWIGTPYLHQASVRGIGCDCLGLVRGVWRAIHGREPAPLPAYSADWGEVSGGETMLDAANRYFVPLNKNCMHQLGDLLIFRWKEGAIAKHAGIMTSEKHFIHAYESAGVVETVLGRHWAERVAAVFEFPPISE